MYLIIWTFLYWFFYPRLSRDLVFPVCGPLVTNLACLAPRQASGPQKYAEIHRLSGAQDIVSGHLWDLNICLSLDSAESPSMTDTTSRNSWGIQHTRTTWCHVTMITWHHDAMTSWRHDTSTSWHNDTIAPWHQELSTQWHRDTIIRWHHDSIRLWHCDSMTKWHHDTTSRNSWENRMGNFDTVTFWAGARSRSSFSTVIKLIIDLWCHAQPMF